MGSYHKSLTLWTINVPCMSMHPRSALGLRIVLSQMARGRAAGRGPYGICSFRSPRQEDPPRSEV
eukprot:489278-Pyramimonas_sp.AAC.1